MITLKIGAGERRFERADNVDESWINQQINGLRRDGHPVCVRVIVQESSVNLSLATPDCPNAGGSPRPLNREEKKVAEIWESSGLDGSDLQGGKLIAFFKKIRKVI